MVRWRKRPSFSSSEKKNCLYHQSGIRGVVIKRIKFHGVDHAELCLALMDAGVPIKPPVSGMAMGLIERVEDDGSSKRWLFFRTFGNGKIFWVTWTSR